MSTYEMRNLSCTIEVLGLEAFQLFEMLGEEVIIIIIIII